MRVCFVTASRKDITCTTTMPTPSRRCRYCRRRRGSSSSRGFGNISCESLSSGPWL